MRWWIVFAIISGLSLGMAVLAMLIDKNFFGWFHAFVGWAVASMAAAGKLK